MKNIFGKLLAIWAMLIFVPTLLIAFIFILIAGVFPEPRKTIIFQYIARNWMRIFFFLSGVRLHISGKEYFLPQQNYIVTCNHRSLMDIPLTTPFIPGPNKTIAKTEFVKVPFFGTIYKTGSVLVDRKSDASRKASYGLMKEVLELGMHMCIYPEGTRNKTTNALNAFQNGAFRLAIDCNKAIIPAVLFNTETILPAGKGFFWWPAKVQMDFLPAISPEGHTVESLKNEVHSIMKTHYEKNKPFKK